MSDNTDTATQADVQPASVAPEVTPQSTERPSWLPDRFSSGEDLARAYADLERQQSGNLADQSTEAVPAYAGEVPANHSDAQALVDSAGLDFSALNNEFMQNGTLSAKSYAELARAGIGREVVDGYIAGQTAIAQGIKNEVFDAAGGADAYSDMVSWAATSFSVNEIDAYNASMNSGNTHQMRLAVDALRSRFVAENGSSPQLVSGRSGQSHSSGDAFASTKEMTAAMSDPRYATDPVYRKSVADKLSRSNIM
jgi:hypothetical protein